MRAAARLDLRRVPRGSAVLPGVPSRATHHAREPLARRLGRGGRRRAPRGRRQVWISRAASSATTRGPARRSARSVTGGRDDERRSIGDASPLPASGGRPRHRDGLHRAPLGGGDPGPPARVDRSARRPTFTAPACSRASRTTAQDCHAATGHGAGWMCPRCDMCHAGPGGHPPGWMTPSLPAFHGQAVAARGPVPCKACHGDDYRGGSSRRLVLHLPRGRPERTPRWLDESWMRPPSTASACSSTASWSASAATARA